MEEAEFFRSNGIPDNLGLSEHGAGRKLRVFLLEHFRAL